jgi:Ca-activated chloride channel family protein
MKRLIFLCAVAVLSGGWWWDSDSKPLSMLVSNTLHVPADWGSPSSGGAAIIAPNYYTIVDGSGSMTSTECSGDPPNRNGRIVPAREAMIRFGKRLPSNANLGLYVFDRIAWRERVALDHGEVNRQAFVEAVAHIEAGGNTPLGAALMVAYEALRKQSLLQNGYGEYHIVVETDGAASDADVMERAVKLITKSPIILETIGFCIAQGHALNQPGFTIYRNAMNPTELSKGLDAIFAESDVFDLKAFKK